MATMVKGTDPAVIRMVQALQQAGFTGTALVAMTSLGISESGGNPNALNDNPSTGDYSVGAFQINYYGSLAPGRTAEFGPPATLLGNLQAQAQAAYKLSAGGQNFNPWKGDYSNGKYYANLAAAQTAVNAVLGGATAPGAPGSSSSVPGASAVNLGASGGGSGCLLNFPGLTIPSVGPVGGGTVGGGCFITVDQGRHILGGLCILGGIVVGAVGLVMLIKGESNPGKALGGLRGTLDKAPATDIVSDKEYEGKQKLAPPPGSLKKKIKENDKRHTYDAATGKNHLGQTKDQVDADDF